MHDWAQLSSPLGPGHGLPEWRLQELPLHRSAPLQKSPSLHCAEFAGCVHAADEPLQISFVQTLPSFVQPVLLPTNTLAGHDFVLPPQRSGRSHSPALARHVTSVAATPSTGHAAELPLQVSAASQTPEAPRQTVVVAAKPSAGHVVVAPVQVSCASQTPTVWRQTAPALPAGCVHPGDVPSQTSRVQVTPSLEQAVSASAIASFGQFLPAPSQVSATSQSPALARQDFVVAATASAGQLAPAPAQRSSRSQTPLAERQIVALPANALTGHDVLVPLQVS